MDSKEFYTVTETAKRLGFSRQTILTWINKGVISAVRGIHEYRVPVSEVERLKKGE